MILAMVQIGTITFVALYIKPRGATKPTIHSGTTTSCLTALVGNLSGEASALCLAAIAESSIDCSVEFEYSVVIALVAEVEDMPSSWF